jgi:hypothetical protein
MVDEGMWVYNFGVIILIGKSEVLGKNPATVSLYVPIFPHGMT